MKLIPVDKKQCQAEKTIGVFSFGGKIGEMVRCANRSTVVITERRPASDGLTGSMSLCDLCLQVAYKKFGKEFFNITKIAAWGKRSGASHSPNSRRATSRRRK